MLSIASSFAFIGKLIRIQLFNYFFSAFSPLDTSLQQSRSKLLVYTHYFPEQTVCFRDHNEFFFFLFLWKLRHTLCTSLRSHRCESPGMQCVLLGSVYSILKLRLTFSCFLSYSVVFIGPYFLPLYYLPSNPLSFRHTSPYFSSQVPSRFLIYFPYHNYFYP